LNAAQYASPSLFREGRSLSSGEGLGSSLEGTVQIVEQLVSLGLRPVNDSIHDSCQVGISILDADSVTAR
jgi:hypothetical protein